MEQFLSIPQWRLPKLNPNSSMGDPPIIREPNVRRRASEMPV
jgi:hypothetical protein